MGLRFGRCRYRWRVVASVWAGAVLPVLGRIAGEAPARRAAAAALERRATCRAAALPCQLKRRLAIAPGPGLDRDERACRRGRYQRRSAGFRRQSRARLRAWAGTGASAAIAHVTPAVMAGVLVSGSHNSLVLAVPQGVEAVLELPNLPRECVQRISQYMTLFQRTATGLLGDVSRSEVHGDVVAHALHLLHQRAARLAQLGEQAGLTVRESRHLNACLVQLGQDIAP